MKYLKKKIFFPFSFIQPSVEKTCKTAEGIRALAVNENKIGVLSLNKTFHVWCQKTFQQKISSLLREDCGENTCLAYQSNGMYGIGSAESVSVIESWTLE